LEELGYGEADEDGNFMVSYPFINYIILDDVWPRHPKSMSLLTIYMEAEP
jgi:hypothetical protein